MTKSTNTLSDWTASGQGLHYASVGQRAYFSVNVTSKSLRAFNLRNYISVLAVGLNYIFVANPFNESRTENGLKVDYSYVPTIPGMYDLYVEEMFATGQRQISSSPFRLRVEGGAIKPGRKRAESDSKPSCQMIPQRNYSWLDGDWITRAFAGNVRGTLRSGWVFQPKLCSFDIFTREDLAVVAGSGSRTTIAVFGTSTERGIFLSMLDLALGSEGKVHLKESDVGKCWGFAQVSLGNLTFIYQDLRLFSVAHSKKKELTCHDEKLAGVDTFKLYADSVKFIRHFFLREPSLLPNVILIVVRNEKQLRLLVNEIPGEWNGTIYVVNNFRSKFGEFYTIQGQEDNKQEMNKLTLVDPRVQIFDGFMLGAGMRHATESSPVIMRSNHFHRWCNELNGEMAVCGNPTEMAAQMLLGKAVAPNGKQKWKSSLGKQEFESYSNRRSNSQEIKVCYDCPASLLPFHVKVVPELNCYKTEKGFKPRNESDVHVWDGSLCPEECMNTEPIDQLYTESGPVYVRTCTMPNYEHIQ